ncbi:MAG: hypothetical protein F6K30_20070 [Cyanothece sp. SIO2G6]|nr:hypothetical protein [Cyanothece sp. SIO2G6]
MASTPRSSGKSNTSSNFASVQSSIKGAMPPSSPEFLETDDPGKMENDDKKPKPMSSEQGNQPKPSEGWLTKIFTNPLLGKS